MRSYKIPKKIILFLLVLSAFNYMRIVKISSYIYTGDALNVSFILSSVISVLLLLCKPIYTKKYYGNYRVFIYAYLIFMLIEIIYSYMSYSIYGQSLVETVKTIYYMSVIIAIFPICYLQERIKDKDYLKKVIKYLAAIAAFLSILQVQLYNYGIQILDLGDIALRGGHLRYTISGHFVSISFLITFFDFYQKRKIKDFIILLLESCFFIYAFQTRTVIVYLIVTLFFVFLFMNNKKRPVVVILFLGILFILAISVNVSAEKYINIFNEDGIIVRILAIRYFIGEFLKHPLIGMGFIDPGTNNIVLSSILYGNVGVYAGKFHLDDIGIVGLLAQQGVIGFLFYIVWMVLLFADINKIKKKEYKALFFSIWLYINISSINLLYVNSDRITILVCVTGMVHHYALLSCTNGDKIEKND